jgi:hypothetical protein
MGTSKLHDMAGIDALFVWCGSVAMAYTKDHTWHCECCPVLAMAFIIISFSNFFGHFLIFSDFLLYLYYILFWPAVFFCIKYSSLFSHLKLLCTLFLNNILFQADSTEQVAGRWQRSVQEESAERGCPPLSICSQKISH